jgi:ATP-dependent helicase YprA (DUF1998 family)
VALHLAWNPAGFAGCLDSGDLASSMDNIALVHYDLGRQTKLCQEEASENLIEQEIGHRLAAWRAGYDPDHGQKMHGHILTNLLQIAHSSCGALGS